MLRGLLSRWRFFDNFTLAPTEAMNANTGNLRPKTVGGQVTPLICHCSVGRGPLVFEDGKLIAIEGAIVIADLARPSVSKSGSDKPRSEESVVYWPMQEDWLDTVHQACG